MKLTKFSFLLILGLAFGGVLSAQTADEIIAKNIDTRGGAQQLSSIRTLKYIGTFKETGIDAALTLCFKSPNKTLFGLDIEGQEAKIGYDGRILWKQFPGGTPAQQPKGSDKLVAVFAEYQGFLMACGSEDYEYELIGRENFRGTETFHILVTPEKGQKIHLLVDSQKYSVSAAYFENPAGARYSFYFSDYRDTDGILFPYSIEAVKSSGQITRLRFEKIETNADIDAELFILPKTESSDAKSIQGSDPAPQEYAYRIPEQVDDGWPTASLTDVDMDAQPLMDLMNLLQNRDDHYVHGLVIVKNGKLVFEEYFSGSDLVVNKDTLTELVASPESRYETLEQDFDRETPHFQASVTKSVTSLLMGIALDRGLIGGVTDKLSSFFPEYESMFAGRKSNITLQHMLAMASGLPWDESTPYYDGRNSIYQLLNAEDPLAYVLDLNLSYVPGKVFRYNSGTTVLMGEIIRRKAKMSLDTFAETYLFDPLGITEYAMINLPNAEEVSFASSGLYLRPRDMAKIGQLVLQGGKWENKRVVSPHWIRESVTKKIGFPPAHSLQHFAEGYGYQWWLGTYYTGNTKAYMAAGFGGQSIIIFPDQQMVVVLTGGNWYNRSPFLAYDLVIDGYILPAIK